MDSFGRGLETPYNLKLRGFSNVCFESTNRTNLRSFGGPANTVFVFIYCYRLKNFKKIINVNHIWIVLVVV
jgi:hypothetical protein